MEDKRARKINDVPFEGHAGKPVIYWMSRDQRIDNNWGLLYSQQAARKEMVFNALCLFLILFLIDLLL